MFGFMAKNELPKVRVEAGRVGAHVVGNSAYGGKRLAQASAIRA